MLRKLKEIRSDDTALAYSQKQVEQARKKNDTGYEARLLMAQFDIVYAKGDIPKALQYARQAAALTTPQDSSIYIQSRTFIAYMLNRQGNSVDALKVAFGALRQTDAKGWRKLSIDCNSCIADIYRSTGQPLEALPYAQHAADLAAAIKDTAKYIFAISTLSNVYSTTAIRSPQNIAKATAYQELILRPVYSKFLSPFSQARYNSNLGRLYTQAHKDDKAEAVLLKSVAISEKGKFVEMEKISLNELLTAKIDENKYAEGIKYGEEALSLSPEIKSPLPEQENLYEQLTRAYEALHDYEHAFKYKEKADEIEDSLMSVEKTAAVAEIDHKYRADKRLILATNKTRLIEQERNFSIIIAIIVLISILLVYRWLIYKRKKEADLLQKEHEQLAKLDAMKTTFFNNISHELRTPLTLIIGPLDELISNPELEKGTKSEYLQMVLRSSKKLLELVNELLDLGKIEAGRLPLKLEPTDLNYFVARLYQSFASFAEYKAIKYTLVNTVEKNCYVNIDREKFEKIANNLIGNALKFTQTGGAIWINAATRDDKILFSVADNGGGIKEQDLPHIFDRYYQGSHDDAGATGGTGIGLAMAKEFAELMSGQITVNSTLGLGTVFNVAVPLLPAAATEEQPSGRVEKAATVPLIDNDELVSIVVADKNERRLIMLVEDHAEMVKYITSVLGSGYHIVTAGNGREALEKLEAMPSLPDLIISDVMMPEMDGFTLLGLLKQHNIFYRIPVIMLTALADTGNKLKALNTGVDDYLTKPFVKEELVARVSNLLHNAAERKKIPVTGIEETKAENEETSALTDETHQSSSPADLLWLANVEALVRKHTGKTDLNILMLSYELAISERQLFRRIKTITGLTPNMYIRTIRLQVAREAIQTGKYRTISEISYTAGFETPAYFSKLFKEQYGRDVSELL